MSKIGKVYFSPDKINGICKRIFRLMRHLLSPEQEKTLLQDSTTIDHEQISNLVRSFIDTFKEDSQQEIDTAMNLTKLQEIFFFLKDLETILLQNGITAGGKLTKTSPKKDFSKKELQNIKEAFGQLVNIVTDSINLFNSIGDLIEDEERKEETTPTNLH